MVPTERHRNAQQAVEPRPELEQSRSHQPPLHLTDARDAGTVQVGKEV